jgi:HlyD family secretion protein
MAGGTSVELRRNIQILFESGTASGLTDRQLLERFTQHRDPAAFEVIVLRHGPMVLRVCRNLLNDPNDALDAFQATFVILVRRSGSIQRLDSVGSWLYGVACRTSARVRVGAARCHAAEGRAALRVVEAVEPSEADDIDRDELGPIVQEEVRRLPEKYRAAVVLCYWEGLTQEQAAAQLGCPLGTVRSRLARARGLLRRRLTRRGLAPLALAMDVATGSIPKLPAPAPELVQSTVQAAVRVAAGQATNPIVSVAVASLVQRILWRTTMIKLGGIAAGVMVVGLAGYGAGLAAQRTGDAGAVRRATADDRRAVVAPDGAGVTRPEQPGSARGVAIQKGEAEASGPRSVYARVEGETIVISTVDVGTKVKKGEVLCELDSAPFRDRLVDQRIATRETEAALLNAKVSREMAEIAMKAYLEGDSAAQHQDAEGHIKLAEAELSLAEAELAAAREQPRPVVFKRAEVAVLRARFALEKAQSRKEVLFRYTMPRKQKERESAVKKAHADEQLKQAAWELMKQKEANLEQQIAACRVVAPIDGMIGSAPIVGSTVRRGRDLFTIAPLDPSIPPQSRSR